MLRYFYATILPLTFAGSTATLLLLVMTPWTRRWFSSQWNYYVRLLPTVLYLLPIPQLLMGSSVPTQSVRAMLQPLGAARELLAMSVGEQTVAHPMDWLVYLPAIGWAVGAGAFLLYSLYGSLRFHIARQQQSLPVGSDAAQILAEYQGATSVPPVKMIHCQVGSPMLVGILRPCILLPLSDIPPEELRMIIRHELIHLSRGDLLYKLAVLVVKTLHWFNPLVWLLSAQVNEWCEFSCDEQLVREMDPEQRKAYGFSILNQLSRSKSRVPSIRSGYSHKQKHIIRRLNLIMDSKKRKGLLRFMGVALAVGLSTVSVVAASSFRTLEDVAKPSSAPDSQAEQSIAPPSEPDSTKLAEIDWTWPVGGDGGWVTMQMGGYPGHTGIDIAQSKIDDPTILAAASGTVVWAQPGVSGYGNYIVLDHGNGVTSLYGHCKELLVEEGDEVEAGEQIAVMGRTGNTTGKQLHFETRVGTEPVDPKDAIGIQPPQA